ncbi:TonB-dependent receptor plug domain-containing protein [Leptospira sp. GIMC2001]|uniref:TonB-dependent receptor plug domain-containing protein n=1 Tax=Leptospira sp. GIMC2001 TaxID=1513297 RepID=UPI0023490BA3|nr:TonB-dependent receptor [Leptospira sp. GIMC2001]WCL48938.1 TonB-dependent receptor [Leptospira sp. GIMC2001]
MIQKLFISFFICLCILPNFLAKIQAQSNSNLIILGEFKGIQNQEPSITTTLTKRVTDSLEKDNFSVKEIPYNQVKNNLEYTKRQTAQFYITGYYNRSRFGNLEIFAQIYNPETETLIDALSISDEVLKIEGLAINDADVKQSDEEIIEKFVKRLNIKLKLNPKKQERREEINEHVFGTKINNKEEYPVAKEDISKEASQVFKLLEEIEVVSATKTKVKIIEAPAAVYVVTAKQIRERGYRTLSDALHHLPGFDFQHNYGIFPELIHQRGLVGNNNRTNIYIDGIQDNNINENGFLAGSIRFPLMNVERIEVVSGPASALYGANAFNGIINIITKDGSTSPGNHAEFTYGSYESNFKNPGASANFSARGVSESGGIQYSIGGYYYKTQGPNFGGIGRLDGDDPVENKLCGGQCISDGNGLGYYWSPNYNNSKEETYNVTAKFKMKNFRFQTINWKYHQGEGTFANGNQQIDFKQRGLETGKFDERNTARLLGILNGNASPEGFIGSNWDFQNNAVTMGYDLPLTDKLSLDSEATVRHTSIMSSSKESYPNDTSTNPQYRTGDFTIAENYARPDYAYQLEEKLFYNPNEYMSTVVGIVARHFVVAKGYGTYERVNINNFAGYIQQSIRIWEKVTLLGGIRHDETSTYGGATNPRASIVYQPIKELSFKALYSTGFREPTVFELFSQTLQRKTNPDLIPETLVTKELGMSYILFKKLSGSIHAFENKIENLIIEVRTRDDLAINGVEPTAGSWNQNQNLGEVKIRGLEFSNNTKITDWLDVFANYTYTRGEYINLPSSLQTSPSTRGREGDNYGDDIYLAIYEELTGDKTSPTKGPVPHIAPHKWNVGFTYHINKNVSFFLSGSYVDVRRNISTNPNNAVGSYTMMKANFRWENFIFEGLYFNVLVNNATNDLFFDPGIRNAAGGYYPTQHPLERRNIWITLGKNF